MMPEVQYKYNRIWKDCGNAQNAMKYSKDFTIPDLILKSKMNFCIKNNVKKFSN